MTALILAGALMSSMELPPLPAPHHVVRKPEPAKPLGLIKFQHSPNAIIVRCEEFTITAHSAEWDEAGEWLLLTGTRELPATVNLAWQGGQGRSSGHVIKLRRADGVVAVVTYTDYRLAELARKQREAQNALRAIQAEIHQLKKGDGQFDTLRIPHFSPSGSP